MRFPENTPAVVRAAVRGYLSRKRIVAAATILCAGFSLAALTALGGMLVDRFFECPLGWRQAVRVLYAAFVVGSPLLAAAAMLRRRRALSVAIRLDQELPGNKDRWATSLDLARRQAEGENVGHAESIHRLYQETASGTPARAGVRLVSWRGLLLALPLAAAALFGFHALHRSAFFSLPLLWQRFHFPGLDLPRDSLTRVQIVTVNDAPPPKAAFQPAGDPLCTVPESDPVTMQVRLTHRLGLWSAGGAEGERPEPTPHIEIVGANGSPSAAALVRRGRLWTFVHPEVQRDLRFRFRAGDGLTQTFRVAVSPRLKITALKHSIRHPGYTKLPRVKDAVLESQRLSLLEGTRLEFVAECDRPIAQMAAVFELLENREAEGPPAISAKEAWQRDRHHERGPTPEEIEAAAKSRRLKVKIRRNNTGSFRLRLDQSGLLRVRVSGENGLPARERVCLIEAVRDSPPRIAISGIELDTYIVPGETVGYEYSAEDDLGVSDLIMDWQVAGSARVSDLAGEEYIKSDQLGQRIVAGQEIIQRMNYKTYATMPFEFTLLVIDSKGQETRSAMYRIHLLRDSYAARFASGMAFIDEISRVTQSLPRQVRIMASKLNIIVAATKGRDSWPPGQDRLLDDFAKAAGGIRSGVRGGQARRYYSGWPHRLQGSTALLAAASDGMAGRGEFLHLAKRLRQSQELPTTIAATRKFLETQQQLAETWGQAVAAERQRFAGEALLQEARGLRQRVGGLRPAAQETPSYMANLGFYRKEARELIDDAKGLPAPLAEDLQPAMARLEAGLAAAQPRTLIAGLRGVELPLSLSAPPVSTELTGLLNALDESAKDPALAPRRRIAMARTVVSREAEAASAPLDDLQLCRRWMSPAATAAGAWHRQPTDLLDVWLMTARLTEETQSWRRDMRLRRYSLSPNQADDAKAELREQALFALDLMGRAETVDSGLADKLRQALTDVARGELHEKAADNVPPLPKLCRQLSPPARARLAALQSQFRRDLKAIANRQEQAAAEYEAYAAEFEPVFKKYEEAVATGGANPGWGSHPGQASSLEMAPRTIEIAYRNLFYLKLLHDLNTPAGRSWQHWRTWHGLQLILMLDAQHAFDRVTHRFNSRDWRRIGVVPQMSRDLAGELRQHAQLVRLAAAGKPLDFDFDALMAESRTRGYFERARKEFELLAPLLYEPKGAAAEDSRGQIARSQLGQALAAEALIAEIQQVLPAWRSRRQPQMAQSLVQLARIIDEAPVELELEGARELVADIRAVAPPAWREALDSTLGRRLQSFQTALTAEIERLYGVAQVPPMNLTKRANLRQHSTAARAYWTFRAVIDNYDRRWALRLRHSELATLRQGLGDTASAEGREELTLAYARMVELRARQTANERRRNRGIDYLQEDDGPSLKLPPHIAREFMRARNHRPPAQFKAQSENYFERLFRDLSH